jgi:hypothetical protein
VRSLAHTQIQQKVERDNSRIQARHFTCSVLNSMVDYRLACNADSCSAVENFACFHGTQMLKSRHLMFS